MNIWNEFKEIHVYDFNNSNRIYFNSLIRFGKENTYIVYKSENDDYILNIIRGCKIVCNEWINSRSYMNNFDIIIDDIERGLNNE